MAQILICQNLRNNLMHPNEYIRGVTLRFLCRIKEEEILEPLTPSILQNLEHRCGPSASAAGCCLRQLWWQHFGGLFFAPSNAMPCHVLVACGGLLICLASPVTPVTDVSPVAHTMSLRPWKGW